MMVTVILDIPIAQTPQFVPLLVSIGMLLANELANIWQRSNEAYHGWYQSERDARQQAWDTEHNHAHPDAANRRLAYDCGSARPLLDQPHQMV
jgi:hypothetical protein